MPSNQITRAYQKKIKIRSYALRSSLFSSSSSSSSNSILSYETTAHHHHSDYSKSRRTDHHEQIINETASNLKALLFLPLNFNIRRMGNCIKKSRNDDEDDPCHKVDFGSGNVHFVTTKEAWDEKLAEASRDDKIVVANFSASWCGPCRILAPLYGELSEKYPTLVFVAIDVDELPEFSSSWDIRATPTLLFFKDGQQIDKLVGANKPELQKKIIAVANSAVQNH